MEVQFAQSEIDLMECEITLNVQDADKQRANRLQEREKALKSGCEYCKAHKRK